MLTVSRANKRFPLPRWRPLAAGIAMRELAQPTRPGTSTGEKAPELLERLERWRLRKGLLEAAELLEVATIVGDTVDTINAARVLVSAPQEVTELVRRNAAIILDRYGLAYELPEDIKPSSLQGEVRWREHLRLYPRDALAWAELARVQMAESMANKSAIRSMTVALALAPHNRHVLRAAARMYVHLDREEHAYALIKRNEATPHDPWLMAAEVALSGVLEKTPAFFKKAVSILESDLQPRQTTELASALGTHLLRDGSSKKSKKLFRQSTIDPNGNSLAQAEWASLRFGERLVGEAQLERTVDSCEARARRHYWAGDFANAFVDAGRWVAEEPISAMAYRGAIGAANMLGEFDKSETLVERALRHNPNSVDLQIDRAFIYASQGKLLEAEIFLNAVESKADVNGKLIVEANRGLIALRRGDHKSGVDHYTSAITGFKQKGFVENEKLARAFYAKEAASAGLDKVDEIIKEAEPKRGESFASNTLYILKKAKQILSEKKKTSI